MPHIDLLELPYFDGIQVDDMLTLVDRMHPIQFGRRETIIREGDPAPPLHIVTAGRVEITKQTPSGPDRALALLDSPTILAEIELFCQIPVVATVQAVDAVTAFTLTRDAFDQLFDARHPAATRFALNVARVACHRLAIADEMLARVLPNEDLVKLRGVVFSSLAHRDGWSQTTGAFARPSVDSKE